MTGIGDQTVVLAMGWTLIHFLWQGAAVALALWLCLVGLRRSAASVRYLAACGALVVALALFLGTLVWQLRGAGEESSRSGAAPHRLAGPALSDVRHIVIPGESVELSEAIGGLSPTARQIPSLADIRRAIASRLPYLVNLWALGVALLLLRLLGGWAYCQHLRYRLVRPVEERVRRQLEELALRMRIWKPVWILESGAVPVPTLVGWLRPLILLPAETVERLSQSQLGAILAHELAHVRRHDYLVNLIQSFMETIVFYHPCVWWISRRIRDEREHCCDDIALELCKPVEYSRALVAMEELRPWALGTPAMAANGGDLMSRIRRLVLPEPATIPRPAFSTLALVLLLFAAGASTGPAATLAGPSNAPPSALESLNEPPDEDPEFTRLKNRAITVKMENGTLADAARVIGEACSLTIHYPAAAANDPVSLEFDQVEADVVYQCLFNLKQMDWREDHRTRTVTATFWEGSGPTPLRHWNISLKAFHAVQAARQAMTHDVGWYDAADIPLSEALRKLEVLVGLSFDIPEGDADRAVTLSARDTNVRHIVRDLAKQHGLAYEYTESGAVRLVSP